MTNRLPVTTADGQRFLIEITECWFFQKSLHHACSLYNCTKIMVLSSQKEPNIQNAILLIILKADTTHVPNHYFLATLNHIQVSFSIKLLLIKKVLYNYWVT